MYGPAVTKVLVICKSARLGWSTTGVVTVVEQVGLDALGQLGSPPPSIYAVLLRPVPVNVVIVTGMVKLIEPPATAKTVLELQITVWPVLAQPDGKIPMVRLAAKVSVTLITPLVAAELTYSLQTD